MHEENGIVYSDNPEEMLTVLEIKHLYSGVYLIKFSNGSIRLFDSSIKAISNYHADGEFHIRILGRNHV